VAQPLFLHGNRIYSLVIMMVVPPPLIAGVLALTLAMCLTASFVSVRKALRGPGRQGRPVRLLSGERAVLDGCCETC